MPDRWEGEEPEFNELGFNIRKTIQRIERESTVKGRTLKEMKERLEREWASKVLADSLEGSCISIQPSRIKYRMPRNKDKWRKVKRSTCIKTPLHFDKEAERMIRQLLKDDVIEEAKAKSPFCSRGFFLQKPSGNGLCLVTDYRGINGLIERPPQPS